MLELPKNYHKQIHEFINQHGIPSLIETPLDKFDLIKQKISNNVDYFKAKREEEKRKTLASSNQLATELSVNDIPF